MMYLEMSLKESQMAYQVQTYADHYGLAVPCQNHHLEKTVEAPCLHQRSGMGYMLSKDPAKTRGI